MADALELSPLLLFPAARFCFSRRCFIGKNIIEPNLPYLVSLLSQSIGDFSTVNESSHPLK